MLVFISVLIGWIFSVCLHEFGHAIVAYRFGDYTVKEKGYLTMNPIHYTDPLTSIILPIVFMLIGGIGLPGGAVYINDSLIPKRWQRTAVSLAGPAMNMLLIIVLCIPFWTGLVSAENKTLLPIALAMLIQLQIFAVLFNLIPIPSLDGFRAISEWLPLPVREFAMRHANMFLLGLFLLFWNVRAVGLIFFGIVFLLCEILGIDTQLIRAGWEEFRFWKNHG
ncbi:MAG TPA: site-2 protease family protein [Candidatus Acidoferrum sp.]|nr:site-2 protease family protein [Candidatus Acidoferrum sp.]